MFKMHCLFLIRICLFSTTKIHCSRDTIVHTFIYYQLMIMKRELVSQSVHKAHLTDLKHNAQ